MKTFIGLLLLLGNFAIFSGCSSSSDEYEEQIFKVMAILPENMQSNLTYKAAPIEEGVAVGCYSVDDYDKKEPQMVFWVKDGQVYAGNGTAKATAISEIEYAPTGIDMSSISAVLKKVE